jgi:CheY-like chemotaxis protein
MYLQLYRRTDLQTGPLLLVVDDERDIREALDFVLTLQGYQVLLASHGQEALDLLKGGVEPDLILLDLMMPVMNGMELLAAIRRDPRFLHVQVIVLTAFGNMTQTLQEQHLEIQDLIAKPFDVQILLTTIARSCARELARAREVASADDGQSD